MHKYFENNVDYLLDRGLVYNLVSIMSNINFYSLQKLKSIYIILSCISSP